MDNKWMEIDKKRFGQLLLMMSFIGCRHEFISFYKQEYISTCFGHRCELVSSHGKYFYREQRTYK